MLKGKSNTRKNISRKIWEAKELRQVLMLPGSPIKKPSLSNICLKNKNGLAFKSLY